MLRKGKKMHRECSRCHKMFEPTSKFEKMCLKCREIACRKGRERWMEKK